MERLLNLLLVLSTVIAFYCVAALNCGCDESNAQCTTGTCTAPKSWLGPGHCELLYNPSVNGDKAWRGCNLVGSQCAIVSESQSVDATFTNGKLTSYSACCGEDLCNTDNTKLNQAKNSTCKVLSSSDNATASGSFSCHCDPNDMITLFDLSVDRGVQWFSSAVGNGRDRSNASGTYDKSARLRRRMSSFCTNNVCSANTIAASGVSIPEGAFPVCAYFSRPDNGKVVRGCAYAPITVAEKESARHLHATFPANPVAGMYDVRVGVNASDRYNLFFECRSDLCNERQYVINVLSQCLATEAPSKSQVAVEPPSGNGGVVPVTQSEARNVTVVAVETSTAAVVSGGGNASASDQNATAPAATTVVVVNGTVAVSGNVTEASATTAASNVTGIQRDQTVTTRKPGGSAGREALHLLCLIPAVVALIAFK